MPKPKGEKRVLKFPPKLKMPTVKTKLNQKMVQDLFESGTDGETVEMWCRRQKISKDIFYSWIKGSEPFAAARRQHRANLELFWQKFGMNITAGKIKNANATTFVWLTKNIIGWKDKIESEINEDEELEFID